MTKVITRRRLPATGMTEDTAYRQFRPLKPQIDPLSPEQALPKRSL